jgi:class 3 adenylate cyclase
MGVVYRALDERLQKTVALKVLPPNFAADAVRRERFLREARNAAAVSHPNIATVHEVGEGYPDVLARYHELLQRSVLERGGCVVDITGDGLLGAFAAAGQAVAAAMTAQRALHAEPWPDGVTLRVRMGLHSLGAVVQPSDQAEFDRYIAAAKAALATDEAEAAWQQGAGWSRDQAIAATLPLRD